jgi:hypothetical protein
MKSALTFAFICSLLTATAQYNTGDAELNASLVKIDADASVNFSLFKSDVSSTYNVPETKITNWSVQLGMKAGDIYFALELARITKRPIDEVVKIYTSNKQKGLGAIAKDLGIKPGSPEFHALKGGAGKQANKGKANVGGKSSGQGKPKGKKGN